MATWQKFKRIVLKRIYTNDTVVLLEKKNPFTAQGQVRIEKANPQNISDTSNFQSPAYIHQFREFLKHGDEGYLAYLDNKCIHRTWVVKGPAMIELHKFYKMPIDAHSVFVQYCETAPEARGKGVFPLVLARISDDFKDKRIFTAVFSDNESSLKSFKKAGYVEVARYNVKIILGIKKVTKTDER